MLTPLIMSTPDTGTTAQTSTEETPTTMNAVLSMIRSKFPSVKQMSTDELGKQMELEVPQKPIVVDVRKPEEFAVSRIPGAHHVAPKDTDACTALLEREQYTHGTPVVFYCSLGYRSSQLAQMMQDTMPDAPKDDFCNLEGSIFKWANEGRPLSASDSDAAVDKVHPYAFTWGLFLNSQFHP
eukprot:m.311271 g.311271  ORF g.311271 m.311271 type:complete len:182 (+) comp15953_c0_seq3:1756-2301(+)